VSPSLNRPDTKILRPSTLSTSASTCSRLADHLVWCIDRPSVILQHPDRVDEPAVVRSAFGCRFGRIESPTGVLRLFAGHLNTVLAPGPTREPHRRRVRQPNTRRLAVLLSADRGQYLKFLIGERDLGGGDVLLEMCLV
jgi:hypothetical protein